MLLWRDEHSEAWLNLWWQSRDTGYHDHSGSCVGVHVITGRVWHEPLTLGTPTAAREYGPGDTFWFPGDGVHRMDHQAGAITIHVYSPPVPGIGHYDLHDGLLRRTQGLPDQPSPPSTALYAAMHPRQAPAQPTHPPAVALRGNASPAAAQTGDRQLRRRAAPGGRIRAPLRSSRRWPVRDKK